MINGTPLDCTLCKPEICTDEKYISNDTSDPGYNTWWVKKFCTFDAVDPFILYFPYFLLSMAILLVLVERGFITVFKAGLKLDGFYNLLVSESLLDSAMTSSTSSKTQKMTSAKFLEVEDSKLVFEVAQSFSQSSSYYCSYVIR